MFEDKENKKERIWSDENLKEVNQIRDMLTAKHNIKYVPEPTSDTDGVYVPPQIDLPPTVFNDIKMQDLGKNTMIY